jgi:hypothetical protein
MNGRLQFLSRQETSSPVISETAPGLPVIYHHRKGVHQRRKTPHNLYRPQFQPPSNSSLPPEFLARSMAVAAGTYIGKLKH